MREIKFRAWDKTREEMINVDMLLNTPNGMQQYGALDVEFIKEDTILMQYTGLKDKNGVDIYEEDLLKIEMDWGYGLAEIIIKVYFENGSFRAKALNSHEDTFLLELPYLEVIGNIYENIELLN